ncbi:alpha/beta hydrolase [Nocardia huaxiensis]|uniref:Alpha/beta hydrolase n=1 Tax=Nocardia huaxiensis TaxID=2755382 RepID=A0A7D6ZEZ5_9NOCA|nr:alpha/beta hydrolase [Nocardia huaxiensis]QLY28687.1 alpha/beta hydrolase [Nocardia huaxiensis]UFS97839.1 alpha/beta hydrolase [Nocardia huaxiensis]
MSTPPTSADSTLTIELAGSSVMTRILYAALRPTVAPVLGALATAAMRLPFRSRNVFAVSSFTDAPAAILLPPRGTRRKLVKFKDFRAEWVWPEDIASPLGAPDSAILYFHGGVYAAGGLNSHRRLVAKIARASGIPVFNVDYRMMPAHLTDTIEDAVAAYRHLLDRGIPAHRIIVSGDSAGGGLAFLLALHARDLGLPMPGGLSVIAPWSNMDNTAKEKHPNASLDQALPGHIWRVFVEWGIAVDGMVDPAWSAVNHDFHGLPPALIQVGSTESLRPDSEELAQRCADAGIPCRLQLWDRALHVFQAGSDLLPDARLAIRDMGAFNRAILARSAAR